VWSNYLGELGCQDVLVVIPVFFIEVDGKQPPIVVNERVKQLEIRTLAFRRMAPLLWAEQNAGWHS